MVWPIETQGPLPFPPETFIQDVLNLSAPMLCFTNRVRVPEVQSKKKERDSIKLGWLVSPDDYERDPVGLDPFQASCED